MVDPNPNSFEALFCLNLEIMKKILALFSALKKVPRRCLSHSSLFTFLTSLSDPGTSLGQLPSASPLSIMSAEREDMERREGGSNL